MEKISILCPTRERARRARDYYYHLIEKTQHSNDVELLLYVDNDDPQLKKYQELFPSTLTHDALHQILPYTLIIGEPISVSKSWNVLAERCFGNILLMGNDDLMPKTGGWDTVLREVDRSYEDKIYCAFFDDGINHGNHCAFPAVSRIWYETLGYFTPGHIGFRFLCNDTWIFDVAKKINRVQYIPEVLIEHQHFTKTGIKDSTVKRHRDDVNGTTIPHDLDLFKRTEHLRVADAEKLLRYIEKCYVM